MRNRSAQRRARAKLRQSGASQQVARTLTGLSLRRSGIGRVRNLLMMADLLIVSGNSRDLLVVDLLGDRRYRPKDGAKRRLLAWTFLPFIEQKCYKGCFDHLLCRTSFADRNKREPKITTHAAPMRVFGRGW